MGLHFERRIKAMTATEKATAYLLAEIERATANGDGEAIEFYSIVLNEVLSD